MPRRADLKHILLIGSGPIVIGQGCEFDYAGTQACLALKEAGCRVSLINSNPATIMTDPQVADSIYIEPLTIEFVLRIIEKEKPDAVLATMGGQTALNLALELENTGIELLGAGAEAIRRAEDRCLFREAIEILGLQSPRSCAAKNQREALEALEAIGLPLMIRSSFSLGGGGSGIFYTQEEYFQLCAEAFSRGQTLQIDEALIGWKEFEMEVIRDKEDNCIVVCSIENIDPMGIHTGDSITVAPAQTLTDKEYQNMRDASFAIVREVGLEAGGSNVQFAIHPQTGRMVVIEMNPRVSRSSALASKATGFPIAKIAAKLALGYTLSELLENQLPAAFEPALDYTVVKIPRFQFEKFKGTDPKLGTEMRSVGEAMAIGRTFSEALEKAMRSLELPSPPETTNLEPGPHRLWAIFSALQAGMPVEKIHQATHIDPWFLHQLAKQKKSFPSGYRRIDGCGAEFSTSRPLLYSTDQEQCEAYPSDRKKILILGSGPTRIGQGIEFDYCCVHAAQTFKELGYETIMVNCNPETVSTDFTCADKLYFSPIAIEDILPICALEKPLGVAVQYGGQTPLNLSFALEKSGIPLLGVTAELIQLTEDRAAFRQFLQSLGLNHPAVYSRDEIEFPLIARPSYVLGGQSMSIVRSFEELQENVLLEQFLEGAIEVDIDAVCDGREVFIPGIMEQVEPAGIHSGDSACSVPPFSLSSELQIELKEQAEKIALALKAVGLLNIQFAIWKGAIYVLEVNPRASRTIPFLSKATGIDLVKVATRCIMGVSLKDQKIDHSLLKSPFFAVKEAVLPYSKFSCADLTLGPEMKSTGEVMGSAASFAEAYAKAQIAAGKNMLPQIS